MWIERLQLLNRRSNSHDWYFWSQPVLFLIILDAVHERGFRAEALDGESETDKYVGSAEVVEDQLNEKEYGTLALEKESVQYVIASGDS